jgi:phage terminase small subunit
MGRPPKPIALVKGHKTKAEKEKREKEEKRLLTGTPLKEDLDVAKDEAAHKEFVRIKKILKKINKDDGLQENVINRYCKLHSECLFYCEQINQKKEQIKELRKKLESQEIDYLSYLDKEGSLTNQLLGFDNKLMQKRKMMLDIEKENIMTIASVLRSIPKKPSEDEQIDPMQAYLKKRNG